MELFRLLGTIAVDNSGANAAIDGTVDKAEQSEGKLSKFFGKIGGAAVTAGKTIAAGMGAGVAAVTGITKSALEGYADYEQLVGGVETLFGTGGKSLEEYAASVGKSTEEVRGEYESMMKAQEAVLKNADVAYQTAGMSANEYMETVTGFSAALIKSLDGDTELAAEKANQAIIDMSDNANKMGSDITSIQNAYSGFAKQNYTMLDNLKLGYGGTQAEMQRLLQDAQAISGIEYDISSYGDVVDAIHVIQTEMGITGTTAKEASSTISGSLSSMKSAWKNLLAGLGNEEADLSGLVDTFVNSVLTVADNIIPRVEYILDGIVDAIGVLVPKIADKLPALIQSILPSLIQGAVALLNGLIAALPSILMILIEQVPYIVTQIGGALVNVFPQLLDTVKGLFGQIWDYISIELLNTGVSFEDACAKVSEIFDGLWGVLQTVWETVGKPIWDMISSAVDGVKSMFEEHMPEIQAFFQTAIDGIKDTWENHLKPALQAIGDFLEEKVKPAFEFVFETIIKPLVENVFEGIGELWTGTLKPVFDGICDFLTNVFSGNWEEALEDILNIGTEIFEGILEAIQKPMETAREIVNEAIDFIKEKFDFDWEFPKLKMPHFTITGEFSLNPPSIPSFGVEWYKKGAVLNDATIFGLNGATGKAMVGGEAGAEAVAPIDVLQGYVSEAVAAQNAGLIEVVNEWMQKLMEFLMQYIPGISNMQVCLDSGVLVGAMAPGMDKKLGNIAKRKARES